MDGLMEVVVVAPVTMVTIGLEQRAKGRLQAHEAMLNAVGKLIHGLDSMVWPVELRSEIDSILEFDFQGVSRGVAWATDALSSLVEDLAKADMHSFCAAEHCPNGLGANEVWHCCSTHEDMSSDFVVNEKDRWCELQIESLHGSCICDCRQTLRSVPDGTLAQLEAHHSFQRKCGQPSRRKRRMAWCIWMGANIHYCCHH